MSSIHHGSLYRYKLLKITALLVPALCTSTMAHPSDLTTTLEPRQADSYHLFSSPPAPEVIAKILFPPKYRSAGILGTKAENQSHRLFGMMINFKFDSASILPESEPMLQALGEMMSIDSVASKSLVVEGHTDAIGDSSYNQVLSEKRAREIKRYLIEKLGIKANRLIAVGRGERELYSTDNPTDPINRRATFRPANNAASD